MPFEKVIFDATLSITIATVLREAKESLGAATRALRREEIFPRPESPVHTERLPTIPDYELIRQIGGGAYGEVWLGRSRATSAFRAIKIVRRRTFEEDRPFEREFEGLQRFEAISREHASQLALFHVGRNDNGGYFYCVMELADAMGAAEGKSAGDVVNGTDAEPGLSSAHSSSFDPSCYSPRTLRAELVRGRLPVEKVVELGLALTEALGHLHDHALVHRDVKPSNVIFVHGRPKLADVGLVTRTSDACSIVGTEGYLPPEGPGTPAADLFALGKVLFEAATGLDRRQFPQLPQDLREWPDAKVMFELNEVVLKACAAAAPERYHRAEEMRAELALIGRGVSIKRKRLNAARGSLGTKVALGTGLMLLMMAVLLVNRSAERQQLYANTEANKLYSHAVYHLQKSTPEDFREAFTNLREAIDLDPKSLKAHYGLFEIYWCDGGRAFPPKFNYQANLRWLADQLRGIDPNSAEYHVVNSYVEWLAWHFDRALQEIDLAIAREPSFARARALKGFYLLHTWGDTQRAREAYEAAERIDYNDLFTQIQFGHLAYFQRDFKQAIVQYQKAIDLERQNELARTWLGRAYEAAGQYAKALDEYQTAALLVGGDTAGIIARYAELKESLRRGGAPCWRQTELDFLKRASSTNYYRMAQLCAELSLTSEVMPYLQQAYQNHSTFMGWLLFDPTWDRWRHDPQFQRIMDKVGFPVSSL